jgi:hypothetical protein
LRIEAEILPDSVRYRERDLLRSYETVVSFDEIVPSTTTYFSVNRWYLVICVGLVSFAVLRAHSYLHGDASLGQLLWATLWAAAACLGTWIRSAHYVGFRAAERGLFFFQQAGKDDPHAFLQSIASARDAYFLSMDEVQAPDRELAHGRDNDAVH